MKLPVIHTTLVLAIFVSMVLLTTLITLNFVVFQRMNDVQSELELLLFSDKNEKVKVVEVFEQNRQIMVTTQILGFLILFMMGVRLCVFSSLLYPPQKGSKFSFFRRPYEETKSIFEDNNKEQSVPSGPVEQKQTEIWDWYCCQRATLKHI